MQKMVQNYGKSFCVILGWIFLGDVLDNLVRQFQRDGAESFTAYRWSEIMESRFV